VQTPTGKPATAHTVEARVRCAETDQMGVVHHSHFLTYFEIGRTDCMRRPPAQGRMAQSIAEAAML